MQARYLVSGMTCDHCVAHVTEEVEALSGVEAVAVSLDGSMVITCAAPLDFEAVREAVSEAGNYTVTQEN